MTAAMASRADRVVVALDGDAGAWLPAGCTVVPQRGHALDERLAAAWADAGGPGVQIGMDTPQVTPDDLDDALAALDRYDAALGLAEDGGWWSIALRRPNPAVFWGIRTSRADTGARQLGRLRALGLDVALLPLRRDVDHFDDAVAVARQAPHTRFAAVLAGMTLGEA
jgi:glycosyltransferase A (GT-A) superfamily protein (DUF2064 family)